MDEQVETVAILVCLVLLFGSTLTMGVVAALRNRE